jgi:hypothetical protein
MLTEESLNYIHPTDPRLQQVLNRVFSEGYMATFSKIRVSIISYFVLYTRSEVSKRNYVVSFFAVKSDFTLTFERREDKLREGTADIIRLTWSVFLLHHRTFSSTVAAHNSSTEEHAEL